MCRERNVVQAGYESKGAYPVERATRPHEELEVGGEYQWRREGPPHLFNPETIFKLQHATKTKSYEIFREYTKLIDDQAEKLMTLRGLFSLREGVRPAVSLNEVEPATDIVKRFSTGAMSYGSISPEAHEVLAIAMNQSSIDQIGDACKISNTFCIEPFYLQILSKHYSLV
jgi:glutamate synthase (NADPH/NADH) large chain